MRKTPTIIMIAAMVILTAAAVHADGSSGNGKPGVMMLAAKADMQKAPDFPPMAGPGKKVAIGGGSYLIYDFDKKPKMGTVIMKVDIYKADGGKETSLTVKADAGMPSMRGAHDTGEKPFQLNKKGTYLIPISLVMPGDWEIKLSVWKEGKAIFRGRYNFDI